MKTFFSMGFQNGFKPDFSSGFRPAVQLGTQLAAQPAPRPAAMGQYDYDFENFEVPEEGPWTPPEGFEASYPQQTYTTPIQTNVAELPKVPATRPPGVSDADWAKILAEGLKAAAQGYGTYTAGQIAQMKAQAELLKAKNPSVSKYLPSSVSPTTIALVVGGVALAGLALFAVLK